MLMTFYLEMYTLNSEVRSDRYQCGTVKKKHFTSVLGLRCGTGGAPPGKKEAN